MHVCVCTCSLDEVICTVFAAGSSWPLHPLHVCGSMFRESDGRVHGAAGLVSTAACRDHNDVAQTLLSVWSLLHSSMQAPCGYVWIALLLL